MTLRCKAVILRESGAQMPYSLSKPLTVEKVTLDASGPMDILVKVIGAGLCHSDLSVINGTRPRGLPLALGHEGAGEIVEVGSAVLDAKPGDHVVFQFSASCGRCERCQSGRPQVCGVAREATAKGELMSGGGRIKDANGKSIAHHTGVSCFAEYAVVDRGSIVVIDKSLPLLDASLFGCAVMTGVGAVINTADVQVGDDVAVIGLGGVGLNGIMGAKLAGAKNIIAVDLDEKKLDIAMTLGATHRINPTDVNAVDEVLEITSGGVDYAIELAGAIPGMKTAYAITRRGGTVVTGGLSPAGSEFAFEHANLVAEEKSIRGSYMGSCVPVRDIPRFIALYQQGRLPVDKLIDQTIGFDEINEGFDRLHTGQAIRQILAPHG